MTASTSLAQALRHRHLLSDLEVDAYLQREQVEHVPLDQLLVHDGKVSDKELAQFNAAELAMPFIDLQATPIQGDAVRAVPMAMLESRKILPLHIDANGLFVAMAYADVNADGGNFVARLASETQMQVHVAIAAASEIQAALDEVLELDQPGRGREPNRLSGQMTAPSQVTQMPKVVRTTPQTTPVRQPTLPSSTDTHAELHVNDLLEQVLDYEASDLHLTVGSPPQVRVHGELMPLPGYEVLEPQMLRRMMYAILTQKQREHFEEDLELDLSHPLPGKARFRVNLFVQRGAVGAVMRTIPNQVVPLEKLGLPGIVRSFAEFARGLVLVTGPTGCGKSTTLASLIDIINSSKPVHIMTVEDPIEFMHNPKRAVINQREVGEDTKSFANALRHVLRQDPDVILVGEMRDLETISTALTAAETGHLVFATLHTQDAPQSIDRIIDVFPPHQQQQVRVQLATSLQAVLAQQLMRTADGRGRTAAAEVMIATPAVRNLIREGKVYQIYSSMQAGGKHGMQTMDQSLAGLVRQGKITYESALERCTSVTDLARLCGKL